MDFTANGFVLFAQGVPENAFGEQPPFLNPTATLMLIWNTFIPHQGFLCHFVCPLSLSHWEIVFMVCISNLLITNSEVLEVILVLFSSIQYRTSNSHKFYFIEK